MRNTRTLNKHELPILTKYRMKGKYGFLTLFRKTVEDHAENVPDVLSLFDAMLTDIRTRVTS